MNPLARLNKAISSLKTDREITNDLISAQLGYRSKNYVSDLLGGNKPISSLFLEKLELMYSISPDYINEGKGEMYIESINRVEDLGSEYGPNQSASQRSIRKPKILSSPYLVPFVDIPAQAGYSKAYSNIDYIETLKMYPILPDVDPMGAVWRYFQVEGDSMEEEIRNKDVLLTSQVPVMDWPDIKDFYTHVVVTEDQVLIKDVLKEGEDNIILLSTNPHYDPVRLGLQDVKQIWVMRRHVKNRVKKKMYDLDEIKRKLKKKA